MKIRFKTKMNTKKIFLFLFQAKLIRLYFIMTVNLDCSSVISKKLTDNLLNTNSATKSFIFCCFLNHSNCKDASTFDSKQQQRRKGD